MVSQDLSQYGRPLGALFELPKDAKQWEAFRLTDEQVAFYHEQGYLQGVRILGDAQIEIFAKS